MIKQVTAITTRNVQTADRAYRIATGLGNYISLLLMLL